MRADSFYSEIGREDPKGNVVMCPGSVLPSIHQLYLGQFGLSTVYYLVLNSI